MTDALLRWDSELAGAAPLVLGDDLATTASLDTAVLISLFTDRQAPADAVLDGDDDRRGWWADTWPEVDDDATGSLLWLLRRAKQTDENLQKAQGYAREALAWLIQDQVAKAVGVVASYPVSGWLQLDVEISLPSGDRRRWAFTLDALGETASGLPGEIQGAPGSPAIAADSWVAPTQPRAGELHGLDGNPAVSADGWAASEPAVPGELLGAGGSESVIADAWSAPPADIPGERQGVPGSAEVSAYAWLPPPPPSIGQVGCGESLGTGDVTWSRLDIYFSSESITFDRT